MRMQYGSILWGANTNNKFPEKKIVSMNKKINAQFMHFVVYSSRHITLHLWNTEDYDGLHVCVKWETKEMHVTFRWWNLEKVHEECRERDGRIALPYLGS
jgi:hypothetical protein